MTHYRTINIAKLPTANQYSVKNSHGDATTSLDHLAGINLLVGPNNSGKSRFLRAIFSSAALTFRPADSDPTELNKAVRFAHQHLEERLSTNFGLAGYEFVTRNILEPFLNIGWITEDATPTKELLQLIHQLKTMGPITRTTAIGPHPTDGAPQKIHDELLRRLVTVEIKANEYAKFETKRKNRIYIPILRGLRRFTEGNDYERRTVADYKFNREPSGISTGLDLFERIRSLLLGGRAERLIVRSYEDFLSEEIFDGEQVELIPHRDFDALHMRIGNRDERPIFELGDGLHSIIVATFEAFTTPTPSILCIEEPDTHLHPGMQRKLLELFLNHEKLRRHQVFATTHSNHLLDMASDYSGCSTILFRRASNATDSFDVRLMDSRDRLVLDDLGVRASSVFLTNATIWVEGVSDRLYLREYLAKYLRMIDATGILREDTHYTFMEGGGSCVAHFDFSTQSAADDFRDRIKVARICSQSFVVLDGDNATKPRLKPLQDELGDKLFLLSGKEIENLLPLEVVLAYATKRAGSAPSSPIKLSDYHQKMVGLGQVLDKKFNTEIFTDEKTIKNKAGLCTFSVEFMRRNANAWSLTPEAEALCARLVRFIAAANHLVLPNGDTAAENA